MLQNITWSRATQLNNITSVNATTTPFPPTPFTLETSAILQLVLYALIFIIGCLGNGLVLVYFGVKRRVKERFSHYLINLAFVDFLTSVFTPLLFIYSIISKHRWKLGLFSCIGISSVGPLTVNISAWVITSIATERYRGITSPLRQKYSCTKIYMTMCFIWVMSIATLIPYMFSLTVTEDHICKPTWDNADIEFAYSLVLLILQSILPSIMMIFMFASIHRTVSERNQLLSVNYTPEPGVLKPSTSCILKQSSIETKTILERRDEKLFNMLSIALIVFIICSIPYNVFYTTVMYKYNIRKVQPSLSLLNTNVWLSMLVTINSCMNFFIYAGLNRSFKHYCTASLTCKKGPGDQGGGGGTRKDIQGAHHVSFQTRMSLFSENDARRGSHLLFFQKTIPPPPH